MDLKAHYQKIREVEAKIVEAFPLLVSLATGDGGKAGTLTEVTRGIAARMLVTGVARLANAAERAAFDALQAEERRVAERMAAASRMQFTVLSSTELNRLHGHDEPAKERG